MVAGAKAAGNRTGGPPEGGDDKVDDEGSSGSSGGSGSFEAEYAVEAYGEVDEDEEEEEEAVEEVDFLCGNELALHHHAVLLAALLREGGAKLAAAVARYSEDELRGGLCRPGFTDGLLRETPPPPQKQPPQGEQGPQGASWELGGGGWAVPCGAVAHLNLQTAAALEDAAEALSHELPYTDGED